MNTSEAPGPWGNAIRALREAKGWTRAQLAQTAGIKATTVGKIERGADTQTQKLRQISKALEVSVEDVLLVQKRLDSKDREELVQQIAAQVLIRLQRGSDNLIDVGGYDLDIRRPGPDTHA